MEYIKPKMFEENIELVDVTMCSMDDFHFSRDADRNDESEESEVDASDWDN